MNNKFEKLISLIIAIFMLVGTLPIQVSAEGLSESDFVFEKGTYEETGISGVITGYKGESRDIVIPETIDGVEVRGIGKAAFKDKYMVNVVLPQNLEYIGEEAFMKNKLNGIHIPDRVTKIGEKAFYSMKNDQNSVVKVTGMRGVERLEDESFGEIAKLIMEVPSLRRVNANAFEPKYSSGFYFSHQYVLLYTDRDNPHNLESAQGRYLVNNAIVNARAVDAKTGAVLNSVDYRGSVSAASYASTTDVNEYYKIGDTSYEIKQAHIEEGFITPSEGKTIKIKDFENDLDFEFKRIEIQVPFAVKVGENIEGKTYPNSTVKLSIKSGWSETEIATVNAGSDGRFTIDGINLEKGKVYFLQATYNGAEGKGSSMKRYVKIADETQPGVKEVKELAPIVVNQFDEIEYPKKATIVLDDGTEEESHIYWQDRPRANKAGIFWAKGKVDKQHSMREYNEYPVFQKIIVRAEGDVKETNKLELQLLLDEARKTLNGAKVSVDGTDIEKNDFYVLQEDWNAFNSSIDSADQVSRDPRADQDTVDKAYKDLTSAMGLFASKKRPGQKEEAVANVGKFWIRATVEGYTNSEEDLNKLMTEFTISVTRMEDKKEFGVTTFKADEMSTETKDIVIEIENLPLGNYKINIPELFIATEQGIKRKLAEDMEFKIEAPGAVFRYIDFIRGVKITYDLGEHGTTTDETEVFYIPREHWDEVETPKVIENAGWVFEGWSRDKVNVIHGHFGVILEETLYAVYREEDASTINHNTPIDDIWRLGHFSYDEYEEKDGTKKWMVTGFSPRGKEIAAKNYNVTLPHITPDGNAVKIVGMKAFEASEIQNLIIPEGIEEIFADAFAGSQIKNVEFPNSLKLIGAQAFWKNYLTEVEFPENIETIRSGAFNTNALKKVVLPDSIKEIEGHVFAQNYIEEVELPNNLGKIGKRAFWFNKIKKVVIPLTLKDLASDAFELNPGLSSQGAKVGLFTPDGTNPNRLTNTQFHVINPDVGTGEGINTEKNELRDLIYNLEYKVTPLFVSQNGEDVPAKQKWITHEIKAQVNEALYYGYYAYYDDSEIDNPIVGASESVYLKPTRANASVKIREALNALDSAQMGKAEDSLVLEDTVITVGILGEDIEFKNDINYRHNYLFRKLDSEGNIDENHRAYGYEKALDATPNTAFLKYRTPVGRYKIEAPVGKVFTYQDGMAGGSIKEEPEDKLIYNLPSADANTGMATGVSAEDGVVIIYDLQGKGTSTDKLYETRYIDVNLRNIPTVNPNPGYKFLGWSLNGSDLTDIENYKTRGDIIIKALYEKIKESEVDLTELEEKIRSAKDIIKETIISQDGTEVDKDKKWITEEEKNEFNSVIKEVEKAKEKIKTQEELKENLDKLQAALEKFKGSLKDGTKQETPLNPDKTDLGNLIKEIETLVAKTKISKDGKEIENSKKWTTEEEYAKIERALIEANFVFEDDEASKEDVDKAYNALNKAKSIYEGERKDGKKESTTPPTPKKADKEGLEKAINEALAVNIVAISIDGKEIEKSEQWTTKEAKEKFEKAIEEAKKVKDNQEVTQEETDKAKDALLKAVELYENAKAYGKKESVTPPTPNPIPTPSPTPTPTPSPMPRPERSNYYRPERNKEKTIVQNTENKNTEKIEKEEIKLKENNISLFEDIVNHWAKEAIEFGVSKGYLKGIGDNKFAPDMPIKRADFVTILGRIENVDISRYQLKKFKDVNMNTYYACYVNWASENGIVNGTGEGNFNPDKHLTREEMAVIMYRYLQYANVELDVKEAKNFVDSKDISPWSKEAVDEMSKRGIISGTDEGKLNPKANATRAQIAQVLFNLNLKIFAKK